MKAYKSMLKTELKLSLRGMDMVIFAILLPLIVMILLGVIFDSHTYIRQSFGALCSISICAGGVMGLPLVISDYRSKQILKRYQTTPISPMILLLADITIYFLYSLVSLITLFLTATLFFDFQMSGNPLLFLTGWLLVMISIFSIGIMVGGIAKNSKIAGVIASALYFPMLIFSGATLPYEIMPKTMQNIVNILPLTQGIKILKAATLNQPMEHITQSLILMIVLAVICSFIGVRFFRWE